MDDATRTELEAAAFRALRDHLRDAHRRAEHRPDEPGGLLPQLPVAAGTRRPPPRAASTLDKEGAREIVYGMPYADWVAAHQTGPKAALDGGH